MTWKGEHRVGQPGRRADTGPNLVLRLGVAIDNLAAIMFLMVTFIASLIHIYSMGYMHDDPRYPRFFAYLSLFCFSMLGLVASSNVFMIFIFWELVGVCSYLLIGFWYEEKENCDAANKAFIVNRVGDVGMLVGLGLLWAYLGTFNFQEINANLADALGRAERRHDRPARASTSSSSRSDTGNVVMTDAVTELPRQIPYWVLVIAGLGVFAGCVGKSAQFPLHVWLPDAMAGPTPGLGPDPRGDDGRRRGLSRRPVLPDVHRRRAALHRLHRRHHAVHRRHDRDGPDRLQEGPGLFDGQPARLHDAGPGRRRLGGRAVPPDHARLLQGPALPRRRQRLSQRPHLRDARAGRPRKKMPITGYTMLVGTLAISGVPFFSGFYSKDAILAAALARVQDDPEHFMLFLLPAVGAVLTAFYMFRMWFLVFAGEPRGFPTLGR